MYPVGLIQGFDEVSSLTFDFSVKLTKNEQPIIEECCSTLFLQNEVGVFGQTGLVAFSPLVECGRSFGR